jgi:MFS superfamily sulfate permease-like transporter
MGMNREYRPHRLVVPFTAALAVVCTIVFFNMLESHGVTPDHAAGLAALFSFLTTVAIGVFFKPLLGE